MSEMQQVEQLAEAAIGAAVPETRLVKPILYLVAAVVAIALVALAWWMLFGRAHAAETKAATSRVEAATAAGTAGAAQDAVKIITVHDREIDHIQTITQGGVNAVQNAADARTPVPAVAAAMRSSLCLFGTYRGDPGCAAVLGAGQGVGTAQPDARGAASR